MNLQIYKRVLSFSISHTREQYYICTPYKKQSTNKRFKYFYTFYSIDIIYMFFIEENVYRNLHLTRIYKNRTIYNVCTTTYDRVYIDSISNLINILNDELNIVLDNTEVHKIYAVKNILIMLLFTT